MVKILVPESNSNLMNKISEIFIFCSVFYGCNNHEFMSKTKWPLIYQLEEFHYYNMRRGYNTLFVHCFYSLGMSSSS